MNIIWINMIESCMARGIRKDVMMATPFERLDLDPVALIMRCFQCFPSLPAILCIFGYTLLRICISIRPSVCSWT